MQQVNSNQDLGCVPRQVGHCFRVITWELGSPIKARRNAAFSIHAVLQKRVDIHVTDAYHSSTGAQHLPEQFFDLRLAPRLRPVVGHVLVALDGLQLHAALLYEVLDPEPPQLHVAELAQEYTVANVLCGTAVGPKPDLRLPFQVLCIPKPSAHPVTIAWYSASPELNALAFWVVLQCFTPTPFTVSIPPLVDFRDHPLAQSKSTFTSTLTFSLISE